MSTPIRLELASLKPGTATRVVSGHVAICVVRIEDEVYAIGDRCSHADVSLSEGEVDEAERVIECWKHGSAFSLVDGQPQSLPATSGVPVYSVAVDGEDVVVTLP